MLEQDIYNLAFRDYNEETESINDSVITNNNDSQKILATVAATLYVFTDKHPDVWVYATGNNSARTRLYRMGITTNLEEILEDFEVYGLQMTLGKHLKEKHTMKHFWLKENYSKFVFMTTIEKLNKSKTPIVKIDKTLEKLRGKNLFPEKLAKANEVIARVGLPKR